MTEDATFRITKARIKLLQTQPFFGMLALRLKLVMNDQLNPPTLATNGRELHWHPKWVSDNEQPIVESGFAHEVIHCALKHTGESRCRGRSPGRWNQAIDYATNAILKGAGFDLGKGWLYSPAFNNMSAEQIYELLPESDEGGESGAFDDHALPSAPGPDGQSDQNAQEQLELEWEIAAVNAATAAQARGNLPAQMQKFVNATTVKEASWQERLRHLFVGGAKDDYSMARPNRKMLHYGLILPGLHSDVMPDVTIVRDTSGSVWSVLDEFMAEINCLRSEVRPLTTRLIDCDAAVQYVEEFSPDDELPGEVHGGGGTDFRPVFNYIAEVQAMPTVLVFLTDGYGTFPEEAPPYPVIWAMTTGVKPPFGEIVRII